MSRHRLITACVLVLVLPFAQQANAQQRIGHAASVKNSVTGTTEGQSGRVGQGDRVFQDEVIETASSSQAEFTFVDETRFSVGSNAKVVLDTFIYDPRSRKGKVVLSATKGAFRFVSGLGRKKNYTIKTPTASIGIRGTIFHMFVLSTGTTAIALIKGALRICNKPLTECRIASTPGRVTFALISGQISREMGWGERYMLPISFTRAFPFIKNPSPFQGQPTGGDTRTDTPGSDQPGQNPEPEPESQPE